jgi:glucoamylase
MTRSLLLGNGRFLLNFDDVYRIRDVYYPHLGIENHSEGHPFRFGVWVDGALHWVDGSWERTIGFEPDAMVGRVRLRHSGIGLELGFRDAIDFELDVFCREITVIDLRDSGARDVRLFFHQDFHISGSELGDTALYEPDLGAIIHYKRDRYFVVGGGAEPDYRLAGFATGQKKMGGQLGTWKDADDGALSGNPITQGSVDSTIELRLAVPAGGGAQTYYWIGAAERYGEAIQLSAQIRRMGPAWLIERTSRYWRLWVEEQGLELSGLPEPLIEQYRTSLLVMRAHVDKGGAIVAALDSDITHFARDTYGYCWPRDAALVVDTFSRAGYVSLANRFFRFAGKLIKREGYFLHKYHPDRSLASSWHPWIDAHGNKILPIQEDETGLVIWSLWHHFQRTRDVEEIQPLYTSLITRAADFMAEYRDPQTGLPLPSWDLWEERRGVLSFTCAAVFAGLDAASHFAGAFGSSNLSRTYARAAAEVKAGVLEHLWDERVGRFSRMIGVDEGGETFRDSALDASLFGMHFLGLLEPDDPRLVATLEAVRRELRVDTPIGGLARYRGDYYHAVTQELDAVPGNPWFIAQCWLARWQIDLARSPEELRAALEPLRWCVERATPSGMLPEQLHPHTGEPLSVTPLTWSHAEFVAAVLDYVRRRSEFQACPTCGRTGVSMERGLR